MNKAKIIGVISIKGGVGKTTTVTNIGASLAHDYDKKVLVLDANFSAPNLGLHFGVLEPEVTLHDALLDKNDIMSAIIRISDNLDVIPGNIHYTKVDPLKLKSKLNALRDNYDLIIVDSSPNLDQEILATMMVSDELFVVSTPDHPTLSCTMNAVKVAKDQKTPITGIILNKVRKKRFELSVKDIERSADVPVLAMVNDDVKILESLAASLPAVVHAPKSTAAIEYKKLAASLIGAKYDEGIFSKLKTNLFSERYSYEVNRELLRLKNASV